MELTTLYDGSINLICANRLEERVLEELENEHQIPTEYVELYQQLTLRKKENTNLTLEQIKAIEEIQSFFPGEYKPMFIKGISAAALCNCPAHFRYSGDIDLFFNDTDTLKELLSNLGYTPISKTPAPHEDSLYKRGRVIVEIHKYFPVLMEPQIHKEDLIKKAQLNLPDIEIRKIEYMDLLKNSTTLTNQVSSSILVTNIEMTIFLLCVHLYKDLFWQPYSFPKVRAIELIEIRDLLTLPSFKLDRLLAIAKEMHALHIVTYISTVIECAFKTPIPNQLRHHDIPIIKLMNDSYSPYTMATPNYLSIMPFLTFPQSVESVGCSDCLFSTSYQTNELCNTYYASTSNSIQEYSFIVDLCEEKMKCTIHLERNLCNGDNFCFILDNKVYSHIWFDSLPDKIRAYGKGDYEIKSFGNTFSISLFFDRPSTIPTHAVIAVGSQNKAFQTVTVNPVCLHLT